MSRTNVEPRWLALAEVEKKVRRVLKLPRDREMEIKHANFAKIDNQKFYVRGRGLDLLATFYADHQVARKESLILDYLNELRSEAPKLPFVAPKKLYHRRGLLIRERLAGKVMLPADKVSNETLQKIARLLLLLQETPVRRAFKEYPLSYRKMRDWALRQIPQAKEAFMPFRGSREAFDQLAKVLERDWSGNLRRQPKGYVHGDLQPQNILLHGQKIALIDFDRGGYFYPLFDAASFAVQFTHAALLEQYQRQQKPDRRLIRRQREVFLKEYRRGLEDPVFRLFKLLIIFNGLAFSTAGFRKKVTGGRKHLLFGLFRQELKQLI